MATLLGLYQTVSQATSEVRLNRFLLLGASMRRVVEKNQEQIL